MCVFLLSLAFIPYSMYDQSTQNDDETVAKSVVRPIKGLHFSDLYILFILNRRSSVGSQLVVPILCDVTHPRKCLVAALLYDLEVAHLDS